jgi:6-phosphogluconolactonase
VTPPGVVVHRDQETLAAAVAARLVTRLVDAQAAPRFRVGRAHRRRAPAARVLAAIAGSPMRAAVD